MPVLNRTIDLTQTKELVNMSKVIESIAKSRLQLGVNEKISFRGTYFIFEK